MIVNRIPAANRIVTTSPEVVRLSSITIHVAAVVLVASKQSMPGAQVEVKIEVDLQLLAVSVESDTQVVVEMVDVEEQVLVDPVALPEVVAELVVLEAKVVEAAVVEAAVVEAALADVVEAAVVVAATLATLAVLVVEAAAAVVDEVSALLLNSPAASWTSKARQSCVNHTASIVASAMSHPPAT